MKKRLTLIIFLMLCLIFSQTMAEIDEAPIQDRAAVLSAQTQNDAVKLSNLVEEKTGLRMVVQVRHFLGGADPDSYADSLLQQTNDSQDTLLLLMVIGEETYAVAAGSNAQKLIGTELSDTLLSANFRSDFLKRDYDSAVSQFMLSTAKELAKQTGAKINLEGLFGYSAKNTSLPESTSSPSGVKRMSFWDFNSFLREPVSATVDPSSARKEYEREDKGLSIGSIIIIGLVLSSIFGKDKKGRRKGCGCGPLGWIFGVFGLSKFVGWRK